VLTPQDTVIDLPRGATALDFAYRLHTDLGHRCRGAKADGQMVPLHTPLATGQRVEILAAKSGGPSRDWLGATPRYLATQQARRKVRQWFAAREQADMQSAGRALVMRELQRTGATQANLEDLAARLGLKTPAAMFVAAARGELGPRALEIALRGDSSALPSTPNMPSADLPTRPSRATGARGGILIVGVDKLLTQLGRCCKPLPPDAIVGFVTRGKGVSIHRVDCVNFHAMARRNPERVIEAAWGAAEDAAAERIYPVDVQVEAADRQGLLRDISELLSRHRINVTAVKTQSRHGVATMRFTLELAGGESLRKILTLLGEVAGVSSARRC
jgi:GTP pyrophosphokinase